MVIIKIRADDKLYVKINLEVRLFTSIKTKSVHARITFWFSIYSDFTANKSLPEHYNEIIKRRGKRRDSRVNRLNGENGARDRSEQNIGSYCTYVVEADSTSSD